VFARLGVGLRLWVLRCGWLRRGWEKRGVGPRRRNNHEDGFGRDRLIMCRSAMNPRYTG
jgi:hypothetical protein